MTLSLLTVFGIVGGLALAATFLRALMGGTGSGLIVIAGAASVFAASVAWIVHYERYRAEQKDALAKGVVMLFMIGAALVSGLILLGILVSVMTQLR